MGQNAAVVSLSSNTYQRYHKVAPGARWSSQDETGGGPTVSSVLFPFTYRSVDYVAWLRVGLEPTLNVIVAGIFCARVTARRDVDV